MSIEELAELSFPCRQKLSHSRCHSHHAVCISSSALPALLRCSMGGHGQGYSGGHRLFLLQWLRCQSDRGLSAFHYELFILLCRDRVSAPLFCSRPRAWSVNADIWQWLSILRILLVHPCIYVERLSKLGLSSRQLTRCVES